MTHLLSEIIGNLFLIIGSLFLFSAGLGVLRMPDTYNRIQTGTKATTLGTIMVLIGLAFLHPAWTLKLIILIFFVMLTNPVSSHALARAAHSIGIFETETTVIDQLGRAEENETDKDTAEESNGVPAK
ncbi:MAG: monovalent cation/H(+) antiporter subunit G [Gammaproteobacteria bacterium]|nr:monovalent cation/H(+) antiporter subunit G [Gammaproteobacteria bacterium]MBT8135315.1 monovalent cation/H(+) antiporter subunit G [Gammaproteobacteria bacterium]NNJ50299.1 monovalent cation/H(+) antiporter subunit G [Gammaproteobacteria bacterium]